MLNTLLICLEGFLLYGGGLFIICLIAYYVWSLKSNEKFKIKNCLCVFIAYPLGVDFSIFASLFIGSFLNYKFRINFQQLDFVFVFAIVFSLWIFVFARIAKFSSKI